MLKCSLLRKEYNGIVIFGSMGAGKDVLADTMIKLSSEAHKYNLGDLVRSIKPYLSVAVEWAGNERTFYQMYVDKLREVDPHILNKYTFGTIYNKMKTSLGVTHDIKEKNTFNEKILQDLHLIRTLEIPIIVGGRTIADYEFWKEKGFLMVGIEVEDNVRLHRLALRDGVEVANNSNGNHNTEKDVSRIVNTLCEVIIDNNGSFDDLNVETEKLLKLL